VRPWIWLMKRFSLGVANAKFWMRASASGRNLREKSNVRPRITSRSMSQRTRLDASIDLA